MRITFVIPFPGSAGGIRVISIYADRLAARGHKVTVVAQPARQYSKFEKFRSFFKGRGWPKAERPGPYMNSSKINYHALEIRRPVRDEDLPDADVIIATWWETAFWVAALSHAKGRKFYFVQHHEVHSSLPKEISRGSYYLPLKKIVISEWLVDIMRENYGDTDVSLVPNSVDTEQFKSAPRDKNCIPTVGFIYSKKSFKGADVALRAISLVRERIPHLKIVVFGAEPPLRNHKLPQGTSFFLMPTQEEIPNIYSQADVWLMPSRSEGFALPILEAMACHCPIVSTRTGCAENFVENGVTGYVVEVNEHEVMAERIVDILMLPADQWRQMSNASAHLVQQYSWEDAVDLFEQELIRSESALMM